MANTEMMYVALVSINNLKEVSNGPIPDYCYTKARSREEAITRVADKSYWQLRYLGRFTGKSTVGIVKIQTFSEFVRDRGNFPDPEEARSESKKTKGTVKRPRRRSRPSEAGGSSPEAESGGTGGKRIRRKRHVPATE